MKALLSSCIFPALISISSLAVTPQYKARTDIATGFKYLYGMAVADFNGDSKPDIATTDNNTKTLYLYLNDGNGGFAAPKTTPLTMAALGPGSIVTGDFNEDGKQDLIIGTVAGAQSTLLLIGNGDGTFVQGQDLPSSFGFLSGIATDINKDKHLDLILGMNGTFFIYLGDGKGNFQQQPIQVQPSGTFYGVAAADFNKDGNTDFVIASPLQTAGVRYYAGSGNGTFSAASLLNFPYVYQPTSVVASDFDGDGNQDLLIGVPVMAIIEPGNGDGTFNSSKAISLNTPVGPGDPGSYAAAVSAADVDGDSKTDVVVAEDDSKTLNLFLNDGTGKFLQSKPDFSAPIDHGVTKLAVTDLNGDGILDFVVANNVTQNISVFLSIKPKSTPTISLTSSSISQFVGGTVSFTARILPPNNTLPTGSVTFMDGSNSLGQVTLDGNGQAVFTPTNLSPGQHSITAVYTGDSNFNAVTSSTVSQAITDMQIASTTPSQTISAGGTASYSLTITPVAGLSGTATITCSQLPSLTTCNPTTVTLNGQPATATLTVKTTAPVRSQRSATHYSFALLPLFVACCTRRRRLLAPILGLALISTLGIFVTGCSSNNSSTSTGTTVPGTPSGSSTFTVTATITSGSQTLTRTTTATLVVQ